MEVILDIIKMDHHQVTHKFQISIFEKRLIALGYDSEGIEDGRALTSDLEVVTQFAGTGLGILDLQD